MAIFVICDADILSWKRCRIITMHRFYEMIRQKAVDDSEKETVLLPVIISLVHRYDSGCGFQNGNEILT